VRKRSSRPEENPSLYPVFTPGFYEKTPARAMFKAARKGKNKLVSTIVAFDIETMKKGGFVKPPQK
jgi:hypothetical protein